MNIQKLLAISAFIYILTCIYYIIQTRSFGTPFKDAVAKFPELQKIKNESAKRRKNVFINGLLISIVIVFVINPYNILI